MFASTISGARRSSSHEVTPLTVPAVPTGMNAGVRTVPWGVSSSHARAAHSGSRARTAKGSTALPDPDPDLDPDSVKGDSMS